MPLRGGSGSAGAVAGVFALDFNVVRSLSDWDVGFRAALSLCQVLRPYGVLASNQGIKGSVSLPQGKKIKLPQKLLVFLELVKKVAICGYSLIMGMNRSCLCAAATGTTVLRLACSLWVSTTPVLCASGA